jgi:hypothetical protein
MGQNMCFFIKTNIVFIVETAVFTALSLLFNLQNTTRRLVLKSHITVSQTMPLSVAVVGVWL